MSVILSQLWLSPEIDPQDFIREFEKYFSPRGKGVHIPLVPDAHPPEVEDGSPYIELEMPTDRIGELVPFLRTYAEKHQMDIRTFPASGFGFAHSG